MTLIDPRQTAGYLLDLRSKGIRNIGVLRALEQTARSSFAPPEHAHLANRDMALPLACGQTMPEPLYAARLAEAMDLAPHHKVLEIGAGSGFFTAVMAAMAAEVETFERFRTLATQASQRFRALGLHNITLHWEDGLAAALAPGRFERIVVHALIDQVPEALSAALAPGGHIFAGRVATPGRGAPQDRQWLMRFSRGAPGAYIGRVMGGCRLSPLGQGRAKSL